MDASFAGRLLSAVGRAEVASYLQTCTGDLVAAARLYTWNNEIAGAFHGPLHWLEVTFRATVHSALATLCGREDWWNDRRTNLHWFARNQIADARDKLIRDRTPVVPGELVKELPFSFWVSLVGKANNYETTLWRPALRAAFAPAYVGSRRDLHHDFDAMRLFRNRIAHYQPIHDRHLAADHGTILRLIGYLSMDVAAHVGVNDRVPEVLNRRLGVCDGSLRSSF